MQVQTERTTPAATRWVLPPTETDRHEAQMEGVWQLLIQEPGMTVGRADRIMLTCKRHGIEASLYLLCSGANRVTPLDLAALSLADEKEDTRPDGTEADGLSLACVTSRRSDLAPLTYIGESNAAERWADRRRQDVTAVFWVALIFLSVAMTSGFGGYWLCCLLSAWLHR